MDFDRRRFLALGLAAGAAAALPAFARTAAPVAYADGIVLKDGERPVTYRISYPAEGAGRLPVIVFSHGANSDRELYDRLLDGWAAAGYAVISPSHMDARRNGLTPQQIFGQREALLLSRVRDTALPLDRIAEIEAAAPVLKGRLDASRAVVSGHSFGGMISLVLGGAPMAVDAAAKEPRDLADRRFKAAILLNPPGPTPNVNAASIAKLAVPTLGISGTKDVAMGDTQNGWEWRSAWFDAAPPGGKTRIVIEGVDHYFGSGICRPELPVPVDTLALGVALETSLAFLDVQVKGLRIASPALKPGETKREGRFVRVESK
jgi:predicted dienelactone hydrolase